MIIPIELQSDTNLKKVTKDSN